MCYRRFFFLFILTEQTCGLGTCESNLHGCEDVTKTKEKVDQLQDHGLPTSWRDEVSAECSLKTVERMWIVGFSTAQPHVQDDDSG